MTEIWLPVKRLYSYDSIWNINNVYEFEDGRYMVSNCGRFMCNGVIKHVKSDSVGTFTFSLKGHRFKLHQIVLQTFQPEGIKDGYSPDHIDRNRRWDNSINNLRWANRKIQYKNRDNASYKYKSVYCKETNKIYKSCQEAEKSLKLPKNMVSRVARGKRKTVHGYHFTYLASERLKQETAQMSIFDFIEE